MNLMQFPLKYDILMILSWYHDFMTYKNDEHQFKKTFLWYHLSYVYN